MIRRILIDHTRSRGFAKRGGDAAAPAARSGARVGAGRGIEVLALDEALKTLARINARKSPVVELRYFGGLNIEETAEALVFSVDTAKRDRQIARAWLLVELSSK